MNSQTNKHFAFRSDIKKLSHQRNLTTVQSTKYFKQIDIETRQFRFPLNQNKLTSQRYSCFQPKYESNAKFKSELEYFKSKNCNCEIFLGNQHQKKAKQQKKQHAGQKKVPRFIQERQLSKSEQTHHNASKTPHIMSQAFSQVDRSQKIKRAKPAEKYIFKDLREQYSFEMDICQSFGSLVLIKKEGNSKNETIKFIGQNSVQKKSGKEQESYQSTNSTIKTVTHCISEKNIFLTNLTQGEQLQIERDFKQLFSSRILQADIEMYGVNEELEREFELILN